MQEKNVFLDVADLMSNEVKNIYISRTFDYAWSFAEFSLRTSCWWK